MNTRTIPQGALDLIKSYESLELEAYLCPANVWTIGYGHTGKDVKRGMVISNEAAEELFALDIARFTQGVLRLLKVPVTDNQLGALVSLAFNIGLGAFRESTLLLRLNEGRYEDVPEQFVRWNKGRNAYGALIVLRGLMRRRTAEVDLWLAE
ncbi:lysozyme [Coralloluteibacterium stylophorae]|uniref:Lysozyme n=1 Tax=Coralloluteibacterium stylophorae TaxID=1776034 RepID=A0A8J7VQZ0_9GAMM|nr:lysozyme [Coralloluteibacterium stylophorae]MBS7457705.1 lysozyme [Coralloluteibacterium stylophorae]